MARDDRLAGMELTCPKCQGVMRSYERNGVTVDQCAECRGIFLDRGELERLVEAENSWHAAAPAQPAYQERPYQEPPRGPSYGGHGGSGSDSGKYPKKRRKSFLEEMFD